MKKSLIITSLILLTLLIISFKIINHEKGIPRITLNGLKIITINVGDTYKENGYKAYDTKDGDITNKVKIYKNINYNKEGTYEIIYKVKNSDGLTAENHRFIKIKNTSLYKDSYDNIDNTTRGWWAKYKDDHSRPSGGADINELKKYNAYYLGPNEKVIYLTFDEGSLDTYVKETVNILDKNNVKATFFLCYKFMKVNKSLIKKMVDNGHLIGNHTVNHKSMPSLATKENFDKYLTEIKDFEKEYKKITGNEVEKIYRDPKGEWSFRDLQIIKDLGYKTYFYSAYYLDFNENVSKEYALNELMKRYHNGAIYLLHPKNKGNYEALDTFIKEMKKLGYRFDIVKNIN